MSLLCAIPLLSSLLASCGAPPPLAVGYVEGEFVLLAPIEVAEVEEVLVRRGDRVSPGNPVATLEKGDAKIAVAQADAALDQARAQLANLRLGRRQEEIDVLQAAIVSAEAQATEAKRVLARLADLLERGIATKADYDRAATNVETADAEVGQAKANLSVARLPARPEEIEAAEHQVKQAEAALDQANWRLGKRDIRAPSPGRVDDIIRTPGDVAGPSAPVISMLPDGAVKLKVYIPEASFSSVAIGSRLSVRCDGCPDDLTARVSYVSPDPEFTPPVIYSLETRQKLVYLVEARPEDGATMLQPGQIVDVDLANSE
ncbi:HlyD family secretion protein [Kumtagia ephedrae]|jgi:HlyD family secretion protein|uniref:HlyD family secretion protein n=1 Tax=Kumtagia ephedrae TaxID=2116701 RepID=A0A2P7S986_9HYPH|nr:HlyD family efflux transporter periplasmic adaptor subunit [Mesorhizobium ephedrae]PSJ59049.1 HlyD family secretion protein [Mesorhizobium ephedrae]